MDKLPDRDDGSPAHVATVLMRPLGVVELVELQVRVQVFLSQPVLCFLDSCLRRNDEIELRSPTHLSFPRKRESISREKSTYAAPDDLEARYGCHGNSQRMILLTSQAYHSTKQPARPGDTQPCRFMSTLSGQVLFQELRCINFLNLCPSRDLHILRHYVDG